MEDERVDRLLRTLREAPPVKAAPDFTARVLARLDAPEGASANWLPRLTLPAAALAATLVVAASLLLTDQPVPPTGRAMARSLAAATATPAASAMPAAVPGVALARSPSPFESARARRALEQIRSERVRLESDLRRLREAGDQPVLYVGGDEQVDLIVDLSRVRDLPVKRRARPVLAPVSSQSF